MSETNPKFSSRLQELEIAVRRAEIEGRLKGVAKRQEKLLKRLGRVRGEFDTQPELIVQLEDESFALTCERDDLLDMLAGINRPAESA